MAGPAIILVEPQLGENIGMAARAMLNCGLTELRLVRPRDGWPSEHARAGAAGAVTVIDGAILYDTTAEAIADIGAVYATTVRSRDMTKRVVTPRRAAAEMRPLEAAGARTGLLFGKEAVGLNNDDVALTDAILTVPVNTEFPSLNLAQAVFAVGYEWFLAADATPAEHLIISKETRIADKRELIALFKHLERELDAAGFMHVEEKRPITIRNLRNILQRASLTKKEVRTLRGVITSLTRKSTY